MTSLKYAKKMILIDPRELDRINAAVTDRVNKANDGTENDMKRVLDRTDLSTHDMMKAYHQLLQRYLRKDKRRSKEPLNITVNRIKEDDEHIGTDTVAGDLEEETPLDPPQPQPQKEATIDDALERELLESVPVSFKARAKSLLNNIRRNKPKGFLDWSEEGEIVVAGVKIPGSNMVDLLHDSLRNRKGYKSPIGWEAFNEALALNNTPETLVSNTSRRDALREQKYKDRAEIYPSYAQQLTLTPSPKRRKSARKGKGKRRRSTPSKNVDPWEIY
jgi:hypothetical protein